MTIGELHSVVTEYYATHSRDLPWRTFDQTGKLDAYHVLVSEIMLQQTQAARVIPKYQRFLEEFPTVEALSKASLASVLTVWSGLGYNRRAKFLHQTAQMIVTTFGGSVPRSVEELTNLPGIGANTAAAIYVYSYNLPAVFIETNIRSVFLHHFFTDEYNVPDTDIIPLVEESLQLPVVAENPRLWYWSLMDYGVYVKAMYGNASRRSKHHSVQPKFVGSRRQARGALLRALTAGPASRQTLREATGQYAGFESVLEDLIREGLIEQKNHKFQLAEGV